MSGQRFCVLLDDLQSRVVRDYTRRAPEVRRCNGARSGTVILQSAEEGIHRTYSSDSRHLDPFTPQGLCAWQDAVRRSIATDKSQNWISSPGVSARAAKANSMEGEGQEGCSERHGIAVAYTKIVLRNLPRTASGERRTNSGLLACASVLLEIARQHVREP